MDVCPHFGFCGGCSKQDLPYSEQLTVKENFVRACLKEFSIGNFHPVLPSPDIYFYRNKMEFSFGNEKDLEILGRPIAAPRVHLGLHPKGRFALVTPTPECRLLSEESRRICAVVEAWAASHNVSVYVRKNGKGDLRHLVIREGKNTGERMVNLVSKSTTPNVDELASALQSSGLSITTFLWTAYDGLSDVAGGDDRKIYWGPGFVCDKIGALKFKATPASFMQTNTHAAEMMIDVLKGWALTPTLSPDGRGSTLIDLYCGSGAIGLSLAGSFKNVIGIEINRSAVQDAEENLHLNNISNVRFLEGKAEELAAQLPIQAELEQTTVIVDPPRAGLHPKMIETLLNWNAPRVFYVSCNPESLARDLKALQVKYDILDVQPMDFFPHTDHIETAVRLQRKSIFLDVL